MGGLGRARRREGRWRIVEMMEGGMPTGRGVGAGFACISRAFSQS